VREIAERFFSFWERWGFSAQSKISFATSGARITGEEGEDQTGGVKRDKKEFNTQGCKISNMKADESPKGFCQHETNSKGNFYRKHKRRVSRGEKASGGTLRCGE